MRAPSSPQVQSIMTVLMNSMNNDGSSNAPADVGGINIGSSLPGGVTTFSNVKFINNTACACPIGGARAAAVERSHRSLPRPVHRVLRA